MPSLARRIAYYLFAAIILYTSWLMLLLSLPYTSFDRYVDFLMTKQLVYHIRHWRISFYVHVFTSVIVLVAGLLQFSNYLLKKYPGLHRRSGKIYAIVILLFSGPGGLVMGFYANGGLPARISFVLLGSLWLLTTFLGWRYALQRRWRLHTGMMIRSYALTLSAISLRLYAFLIGTFNLPLHPVQAYILISWLSWTLNLLIAEMIIRKGLGYLNDSFPADSPSLQNGHRV
ncbi:DUF2306 domain-containing protein [Chitinophaga filiformis]|uniref:DUF2306 domain-containing protein n=1 Tax=Chitinophaga filiformis TaxID=104663 RepID=UPI001F15CB90|nr:DUF2306 domain-containing protein [Chitinophaga filiformis]MCF6401968.1 DUF2306 domain-containing protein [Chitinophaga filiformis]